MGKELQVTPREGYLHVEFTGAFSVSAAKGVVDVMVAACAKEKCAKVLCDYTAMSGEMPVMDRFAVGEYAGTAVGPVIKIAMLGRPDQRLPDDFLENVAVNRGMRLKIFSDREKAVAWLRS
ncbi:MAG: hypothetical protein ACYS47_03495 [Planctomycetota bacterium]|jgi:hypothetical protein